MNKKAKQYLEKPRDISTMSRAMAYIIDRCIISLVTSVSLILIWYLTFHNWGDADTPIVLVSFPDHIRLLIDVLFIVFLMLYEWFIPFIKIGRKQSGQSFGKFLMKIKVVSVDEQPLGFWQLGIREVVVVLLLECSVRFFDLHVFLRDILQVSYAVNVPNWIELIGLVIVIASIVYCVFVDKKRHQMLHDIFAKTKVMPVESN